MYENEQIWNRIRLTSYYKLSVHYLYIQFQCWILFKNFHSQLHIDGCSSSSKCMCYPYWAHFCSFWVAFVLYGMQQCPQPLLHRLSLAEFNNNHVSCHNDKQNLNNIKYFHQIFKDYFCNFSTVLSDCYPGRHFSSQAFCTHLVTLHTGPQQSMPLFRKAYKNKVTIWFHSL